MENDKSMLFILKNKILRILFIIMSSFTVIGTKKNADTHLMSVCIIHIL